MYIRIIRGQTQPGQVEEVARRWQELVAPHMGSRPGFRHVSFGGDPATNQTVSVSVWHSKPGPELDQSVQEFVRQVQDLVASPPVIEMYEVLAEV